MRGEQAFQSEHYVDRASDLMWNAYRTQWIEEWDALETERSNTTVRRRAIWVFLASIAKLFWFVVSSLFFSAGVVAFVIYLISVSAGQNPTEQIYPAVTGAVVEGWRRAFAFAVIPMLFVCIAISLASGTVSDIISQAVNPRRYVLLGYMRGWSDLWWKAKAGLDTSKQQTAL